jgi:nitroimidazol reductase NimA-like FMN-containing flavoprotein (pyridoxamine 5'-phosphate oxidase superfamily)
MNPQLTSQQIWDEVKKNTFAVLGMVTVKGEPRTVGIVYVVDDHKLYIGAERTAWKTKHIEGNPHVSATVPIPKRVPLMPWINVPAATITFSGTAQVLEKQDLGAELLDKLYRHDDGRGEWCAIEMTPEKDFITYGVGVSLLTMRSPAKSRSRAPVWLDEVFDARTDSTTADPGRRTDASERFLVRPAAGLRRARGNPSLRSHEARPPDDDQQHQRSTIATEGP